ncbi:response regulator transcription factor, partial [Rhodothermus sp. AH-315-K08]|nr:response regulator transcription factor [Rhodothermus sp. AH-315-K08]
DDNRSFMEGIHRRLASESGLAVIGLASDGKEALELTSRESPDLLLLDMEMPEMSGLEVTRELSRAGSRTTILALSGYAEQEYILGTLELGAAGYLMKDESLATIVGAVWTVLEGGVFISSRLPARIIGESVGGNTQRRPIPSAERELIDLGVTPRLLGVFQLLAIGLNNQEIAERGQRSEHTVRNQIESIKKRIGVRWRAAAVAWAWKKGVPAISQPEYRRLFKNRRAAGGPREA